MIHEGERNRKGKLKLIAELKNMRFIFHDSFIMGSFYCILEWDDGTDGKFTLFNYNDVWIEKNIKYNDIDKIIELLNKYDYFDQIFYEDDNSIQLDGYTFGLEVKHGKRYKELCIWGIRGGLLYEIGMLLINLAEKTFKELYKYAW